MTSLRLAPRNFRLNAKVAIAGNISVGGNLIKGSLPGARNYFPFYYLALIVEDSEAL
jgi:hypothetical protein